MVKPQRKTLRKQEINPARTNDMYLSEITSADYDITTHALTAQEVLLALTKLVGEPEEALLLVLQTRREIKAAVAAANPATPRLRIGKASAKHLYAVNVQVQTGNGTARHCIEVDANNRTQAAALATNHFIPQGFTQVCDVNQLG